MEISFTKMQGTGNDMIVIDNRDEALKLSSEQVAKMCERRFGIGADGLILIEKSDKADFFMNYYNGDGSIGEMCGNGVRCAARFFVGQDFEGQITVDTRAGVKTIEIQDDMFSVNMGAAVFEEEIEKEGFKLHCVSMGNPHAVSIVPNVDDVDLENVGPKIENDDAFPNKTNFEIVEQIGGALKMRVWERGSGLTLACGTGACAVYAVCKKLGMVNGKTEIILPGGSLWIEENDVKELVMTGPAQVSFEGKFNIEL